MLIYGENIILRAVESKDNPMLLELINDPETEKMVGGSSWPISEDDQLKWFSNKVNTENTLRCIVSLKANEEGIGTVILSDIDRQNGTAQIHVKMSKTKGRGKGYGTDAVRTIVKYAFDELRLHCIYANILSYNDVSMNLFSKCGFKKEGVLRDRVYKGGKFIDVYSYSVLNS